jgi:hypothetical protein
MLYIYAINRFIQSLDYVSNIHYLTKLTIIDLYWSMVSANNANRSCQVQICPMFDAELGPLS